ncbi:MAG: hypothetical protein KBH61_01580 [Parabacteroides sp.]|jgi:hypothetical protein|nr:hypothetical protein [Parabacteroides sp.]
MKASHPGFNFFFLVLIILGTPLCSAQIQDNVFMSDYKFDPAKKGQLSVEIDNISFFQNNEFSSDLVKGYTLPGMWLQPKAVFYPLDNIKLEAGLHLLRYWGANKYPSFAYTDIAKWKGNQYQSGVHLLPIFRVQVALSDHLDLILGTIYGGANHRLIDPLYNPELNLSADPESGLQLKYTSKVLDLDTWVNWESFIFETDTHQEAFTFGVSSKIKLNNSDARLHFYLPVQALAQHRGGEIDTIFTNSIQTNINAAAGVGVTYAMNCGALKQINFELMGSLYYQQAGNIIPFEKGYGIYPKLSVDVSDFRFKAAYWQCDKFVSLYGSPFFGSLSTAYKDRTYTKPGFISAGLEYSRSFGKGFSLGADLDIYKHFAVDTFDPALGPLKEQSAMSFSAGVYLRINPSFLIKSF